MMYFHSNESIVYMTRYGVEKVMQIEKTMKRRKTIVTLKETANMFYSERDLVRRILYDAYSFKREMVC